VIPSDASPSWARAEGGPPLPSRLKASRPRENTSATSRASSSSAGDTTPGGRKNWAGLILKSDTMTSEKNGWGPARAAVVRTDHCSVWANRARTAGTTQGKRRFTREERAPSLREENSLRGSGPERWRER